MQNKLYDPAIHQDMDHLIGYKFRNEVLKDGIELFKKNNPEYEDAPCSLLAQLTGLAESTFKKLKQGLITDPRSSTVWLVCRAFNIDPRAILGFSNVGAAVHMPTDQASVSELRSQLAASEQDRDRLRKMYNAKCEEAAASAAENKQLHMQIDTLKGDLAENSARHARRDKETEDVRADFEIVRSTLYKERVEHKKQRVALALMCGVTIVALAAAVYLLWEVTNLDKGIFRT